MAPASGSVVAKHRWLAPRVIETLHGVPLRGSIGLMDNNLPAHAGSYLLPSLRDSRNLGKEKGEALAVYLAQPAGLGKRCNIVGEGQRPGRLSGAASKTAGPLALDTRRLAAETQPCGLG